MHITCIAHFVIDIDRKIPHAKSYTKRTYFVELRLGSSNHRILSTLRKIRLHKVMCISVFLGR
jgi:hypothetical protein